MNPTLNAKRQAFPPRNGALGLLMVLGFQTVLVLGLTYPATASASSASSNPVNPSSGHGLAPALDSARTLLRTGRPSEARALVEAWLNRNPLDVEAHRLRQDAMLVSDTAGGANRKAQREVQREYRERHEKAPQNPDLLYLYGRTQECPRALPLYRQAVAIDSCSAWSLIGLGVCQFEQGAFRSAEATFRTILNCRDGFPEAYRNLLQTLMAAGDPAGARKAATELLGKHPAYGDAWEWVGDLELQERKAEEALSAYRKAQARGSVSAELMFKMGYASFALQRWREAVGYYRRSVEYGRIDYGVHYNLAASCEKAGYDECAIVNYRKALALRPGGEARVPLANSLSSAGLYDEAAAQYESALRHNPRDVEALFGLANAHHSKGDIERAEKLYLLLLSRDTAHAKANYNLGSLYAYHRSDLGKAGTHWKRYLESGADETDRDKLRREMRRLGIP